MHDRIDVVVGYPDGQAAVFRGTSGIEPEVFVLKSQGVAKLVTKDGFQTWGADANCERGGVNKQRPCRSRAVGKERNGSVSSTGDGANVEGHVGVVGVAARVFLRQVGVPNSGSVTPRGCGDLHCGFNGGEIVAETSADAVREGEGIREWP